MVDNLFEITAAGYCRKEITTSDFRLECTRFHVHLPPADNETPLPRRTLSRRPPPWRSEAPGTGHAHHIIRQSCVPAASCLRPPALRAWLVLPAWPARRPDAGRETHGTTQAIQTDAVVPAGGTGWSGPGRQTAYYLHSLSCRRVHLRVGHPSMVVGPPDTARSWPSASIWSGTEVIIFRHQH